MKPGNLRGVRKVLNPAAQLPGDEKSDFKAPRLKRGAF
jgi:hypothetical protein